MSTILDFYSGVGGWSLGFKLAGVSVSQSFEWWPAAVETYNENFGADEKPTDIRELKLTALPRSADFIIGSPPCTQFSYSNRGGSGDIADGLVDIKRFLEVVEKLKPRAWAMENVPRVAKILAEEIKPGGSLARFEKLFSTIIVVKMEEFGLPQRRRRMIAGNFDEQLLLSYREAQPTRTLGQVVKALAGKTVRDPIYGIEMSRDQVSGLEREEPLSSEEARMNKEAKDYHPVYNVMEFPDSLKRPARTVTATCTRVSRESIVIEDSLLTGTVRRLSVRERASLQGFPITHQFYGDSHTDRLKMVGNAIPPVMTYFLAHCFKGTKASRVPSLQEAAKRLPKPKSVAATMRPDRAGSKYPAGRRFQAAIPGLRFGSGMRFELANSHKDEETDWAVRFFFGGSKKIRETPLDIEALKAIERHSSWQSLAGSFSEASRIVNAVIAKTNNQELQAAWRHKTDGIGPYKVVDELGLAADIIAKSAKDLKPVWIANLVAKLSAGNQSDALLAVSRKFSQYDARVLAGLLIGSYFNVRWHQAAEAPAAKRASR